MRVKIRQLRNVTNKINECFIVQVKPIVKTNRQQSIFRKTDHDQAF